ncbi:MULTISPECIES: DUF533 domain-containing protein [unclassified Arsukibacterium]|uniref:DUF533 domain-containing protein n=1 Tax=unclassified Arsukibacterium TaxID=2635278 RepID=UPI0032E4CA08
MAAALSPREIIRFFSNIDRVSEAEVEVHSKAILIAVIAAAKSDGHIDDREREIIDAEAAQMTNI